MAPDERFSPHDRQVFAETDPSPVSNELSLIRSTLSHKGRGEKEKPVIGMISLRTSNKSDIAPPE
jgi:hypothetical protein